MKNLLLLENFFDLNIEVLDLIIGKETHQLETIINGIELSFEISPEGIYFLSDDDEQEALDNDIILDEQLQKYLLYKMNGMRSDARMRSLGFFKKKS